MGVDMNPGNIGPKVNESLETNIEGVFRHVEMYCMYMIWWILYQRKQRLRDEMQQNM